MDDLLEDAEEIKVLYDEFSNRLKDDRSNEASTSSIDEMNQVMTDYLENCESDIFLPESIRNALYTAEKPFTIPSQKVRPKAISKGSDELVNPPYVPTVDPLSYLPAGQSLFTVLSVPIVDDYDELIGMSETWGKAVDPVEAANSMKNDAPATSALHHMKGNGLEIQLDIQKASKELLQLHLDDAEEARYANFETLLSLGTCETTSRWPKIVETEATPEKVNGKSKSAPTPSLQFKDDFEMMNFINTPSAAPQIYLENTLDAEDISQFVKKKKKTEVQMNPVDVIPSEALQKPKMFEDEIQASKSTTALLKPVKGHDGFEFAEMLDGDSNLAEYQKMKDNLARTYPFELDPFQQKAIVAMENGHSVFVSAHTSAGKTVVAEYAIALSRKHRSKVVYTSPIKALSNQKYRDFRYQFEDVGLVTGDNQINDDASCLIMTTEILKSMLYNGRVSPDELEWVIFDEVHYINDIDRGHVWEEVLIMLPHQVKIVMLSATVPNCLEFADWVGRIKNRKIYVVQTFFRPVPLAHHLYFGKDSESQNCIFEIMGCDGKFNHAAYEDAREAQLKLWGFTNDGDVKEDTHSPKTLSRFHYVTLVFFLKNQNLLPAVAFVFSRKRCDEYAEMLISKNISLTTYREKNVIRQVFAKYLNAFTGSDREIPQVKQMERLCEQGFAVHHSGVLPILKELVEILFQYGFVKLLFATETFAMGVNMPARTVVFDSLEKFDGVCRRPLTCTEYIQMAGRAGRRGIDDIGYVIMLSKGCVALDYSTLSPILNGKATALESKFRITYTMLLNIIRAEQLNIEDMLQRSYVERVSLRALSSKNEKINETEEKIKSLATFSCPECTEVEEDVSIDSFYTSMVTYINKRATLLPKLIKSHGAGAEIFPGRYLLICYPQKNIVCMLVCVHSFTYTNDYQELNVFTLETSRKRVGGNVGYDLLAEENKARAKQELLFDHSMKHGLETLVPNQQSNQKLEFIRNVPLENIIGICKSKVNQMDLKAVSEYFDNVMSTQYSPSQYITNLMTEMDIYLNIQVNSYIHIPADKDILFQIGKDLNPNEAEIAKEVSEFIQLRKNLLDENRYPCRRCLDFDAHMGTIRERKRLEAEFEKLKFQTSFAALALTDDYMNCLDVLKELNFIDKDNILTIKGRVAAQINEDTLLLTELIFENMFHGKSCAEIAALLCTITAQHCSAKNKENERTIKVQTKFADVDIINNLKEDIASIATKIDVVEKKCGVANARPDDITFGLMEVVYQWAKGMPFAEITRLTTAQEGIVVRCIQRLDEILRDIRNAGRIIGDNTLVQKMIETSAAIRRDIVFAPSLYTTDDDW